MPADQKSLLKPRRLGLWLVCAAFLLFTGIYALRNILVAPHAIAYLQQTVATHLGLDIQIGQLRGSYFSSIIIKNVTTEQQIATGPFTRLELRDVNIRYNLFDLFKGLPAFLSEVSIDLTGGALSIDLAKMPASKDAGTHWPDFRMISSLPLIQVRDSSLKVKGIEYETRFKDLTLTTRPVAKSASREMNLRVAEWSLRHPGFRNIKSSLNADIMYSDTRFTLENLVVGRQALVKSLAIDLGALPDHMPVEAVINPAGGSLKINGRLDADRLRVQLAGNEIDLKPISGLLASDVAQFDGILSVNGHLDLPFNEPDTIETALDIRISKAIFNGILSERLAFRFASKNGNLEISDLNLINDTNRLSIIKASVPAKVVLKADPNAVFQSLVADWYLEGSNIPVFLKLIGVTSEQHDEPVPYHVLKLRGMAEAGNIRILAGSLATDSGDIRLQTARISLPIGARTFLDSQLAANLQVDLSNIAILSQIFGLPTMGGAIQGDIQIAGTLKAPLGRAKLNGDAITYQNIAVGDLSLQAEADTERVAIETFTIQREKDRANGRGTINWMEKSFKGVHVELDVKDLHPYVKEMIPLFWHRSKKFPRIQGALKGKVKLSGTFAEPEGILNLQTRQIHIDGAPFGDADVDLRLLQDKLTVSSAEIRNLNDRLHLRGTVLHRQKQLDDIRLIVNISDLSAYAALWQQADMLLSGSLNGQMRVSGALLNPDADAELQVENLRFQTLHIDSGFVKLKSANRQFTIESAQIQKGGASVQLVGRIQRNVDDTEFDISLDNAAVIGQDTLLALEEPQKCRLFRNGRVIFNPLALSGSAGRLSVSGAFDPDGKSALLVTIADLRSDGWLGLIASDRIRFEGLNAQIKVLGPVDAPIFTVFGSLDNLGSRDTPTTLAGKFNVKYGDRHVQIREFLWSDQKGQQIYLKGTLPLDPFGSSIFAPGQLALNGRMQITDTGILHFVVPQAEDTDGSIHCDLQLTGTWADPAGSLQLEIKDLQRPASIKPLPPGPYTVSANVRINENSVSLERLEAHSAGWRASAQGQWTGAPSPVEMLRSPKRELTGQIHLEGSLDVSDLHWLAKEFSGVRRLSGALQAYGSVKGPITSPAAQATIKLSDAQLSPDFDMPPLADLQLEASVTPAAITVQTFSGQLGGAPFELSGTFKTAMGTDSTADFVLRGENILLYRNESFRLRADTQLALTGPLAKMELSGEVAVTDGGFFKNFGILEGLQGITKSDGGAGFQLFSIRKSPFNDMRFNVSITAKESFLIRNNLARGSIRPDLILIGTGEVPLLVGKVYVEPTRLYLPAGRMNLQPGLVRFEQTDPDRPELDLLGKATLRGFDITAVIDGPADEPVITLSSVPPLPDEELLMLLLTGKPPTGSASRSGGMTQGLNVAMFVGRDFTSRLFGESDETVESIIDRFDVEVGRSITQRGEETIHAQFRLSDNFLIDGDSLYLTGERDYFDYYNGGMKLVFRFR